MNITVFAKQRVDEKGKPFTTYITRLTYKDGSEKAVTVRFKDPCKPPKICPCNIIAEKGTDFNKSKRQYIGNDGTIRYAETIYISNYKMGDPYVDHSCDDLA